MANKRKVIGAAAVIVGFAVFAAAGYYIGRSGADNLQTAIPKESVNEENMPLETQAAGAAALPDAQSAESVTYITRSKLSAVEEGEWSISDTYTGFLTESDDEDTLNVYYAEDKTDSTSQNWVAEIQTADGGYYTLTNQSLTEGKLYVEVDESKSGEKSIILIAASRSGVTVKKYTYSESGFIEDVFNPQDAAKVLYTSLGDTE